MFLRSKLGLIVLASVIPWSYATAQGHEATVRPCTSADWKVIASLNATTLLGKDTVAFSFCEALTLPSATDMLILRLHSPIHTDYSETVSLIDQTGNSKVALIRSGEGLYTLPDPNAEGNKRILNDLIENAHLAESVNDLIEVSNIYAFILDIESKKGLFTSPSREHPLQKGATVISIEKQTFNSTVSLPTRSGLCSLHFTKNANFFQLSKVACLQA